MNINLHIHRHPDPETEEMLMAISAEIQDLVTQVKANAALEQSADAALKAQAAQIADLTAKNAALEAQIAAGAPLGAEDVAALAEAKTELVTSADTLHADIPAAQ